MDEWEPHQISPPPESEFLELERQRRRRSSGRAWTRPLLVGAGVVIVGVMSFAVCSGPDPELRHPSLAALSDAEIATGLESGLIRPEDLTAAGRSASSDAAETPDVAAPGPPAEVSPPVESVAAPRVARATTPPAARPDPPPAAAAPEATLGAGPATGAFSVQLASVRDPASTQAHWDAVRAQHPDLFESLSLSVQRADLGEKGVYHRLRVGPFANRAAATRTCDSFKARGGSCLVVAN